MIETLRAIAERYGDFGLFLYSSISLVTYQPLSPDWFILAKAASNLNPYGSALASFSNSFSKYILILAGCLSLRFFGEASLAHWVLG